jgi:hypothetical protein
MFAKEFETEVVRRSDSRMMDEGNRPVIETWPEADDFALWVSSHEDKVRCVICATPEFKDSPFCGRGSH